MYGQIYTYTLIRCLYNKGEDYLDSFYPLIVNILPADRSGQTLEEIQNNIISKYSLKVPLHSLSIIANRAKKKGYIRREERKCYLTLEGSKFVSKLESERDELRRINEFISETKNYLESEHQLILNVEDIEKTLEKIIKENIESFGSFIYGNYSPTQLANGISEQSELAIIDFIIHVEESRPTLFSTLEDIIAGGIISTIIYSTNIEVIKKKFEKISLFLDSNYLFRLFGLSFKEQNQPAEELFELIKSQPNIELRVFDFTIEEFTNVLKNYQIEQYYYPPGLKINSLYSSLKALGWTSADLKEFIVNLENKLKQFGISIYPTTVDLNVSSLFSEERRALLARYKTDQTFRGQNHDLSAIDQIRLFRKESKKKIESCEALFLSSDIKLSKFNYLEDKHKGNSTISEVMPDKLFTNYLWLKNPVHNKEIHISSWISLNKRHFYIDRSVWQAFYDNLKKLREKGKITDTDISILIYDKQIQSILTDTDPSDIEYIEAEWILDCIIKAKNRQDLFQKNKIKDIELFFDKEIERSKKEVEFLSKEKEDKDKQLSEADKKQLQLEERVKILEKENQEKTKQQIDAILKWKKQQETRAELIAHRWLLVISFLTMLLFFSILPILHGVILRNWNVIEPMMFLTSISFTIIIAIIGKRYDPLNIRRNIYDKIFQYVYNKKLKLINELEHQINVMSLPNIQEF